MGSIRMLAVAQSVLLIVLHVQVLLFARIALLSIYFLLETVFDVLITALTVTLQPNAHHVKKDSFCNPHSAGFVI